MPSLDTLKARAKRATKFRGHKMNNFYIVHGEGRSYANAECVHCGAWVQCNSNPLPNQIDVGGPAVALNCSHR